MKERFVEYARKRNLLMAQLLEPAKAAAIQMADAGLKEGSDRLKEILFQLDAIEDGVTRLIMENPADSIEALEKLIGGRP